MSRIHIAIGPITPHASWKWLGPHMAASLADSYTIRFFTGSSMPRCDLAIFIKELPVCAVRQAHDHRCRIIYMPVDRYLSRAQLDADAPFLERCSSLLVHSRPLGTLLAGHNPGIRFVDHPNLYGLATRPPFRPEGYVLWIGDFFHLPYLLRWRESIELPYELKILTNGRRTSLGGMAMTLELAERLGVNFDVKPDSVNGIPMYEWNAVTQARMMQAAKAAVDIKGGSESFSQETKPPTKAQQLIVSGIPFAINHHSSVAREMLAAGFEVADVADQDRWFSREYWQYTRTYSGVLEEHIRPEAVALAYRLCVEEAIGRRIPRTSARHARTSDAYPPAALDGIPARWSRYLGAFRVLRSLGVSRTEAAPHPLKNALNRCRTYVPGYLACTALDRRIAPQPIAVSVLLDPGSQAIVAGRASAPPGGIPDNWEIIGFRPLGEAAGADLRLKILRRWPMRGVLRDRMLAAAHAEGELLAFIGHLDGNTIDWLRKAAAALVADSRTGLIRREPDHATDMDGGSAFIIRRDVWLALRGYHPGPPMGSPCCGDLDLVQRTRRLGYRIGKGSGSDKEYRTPHQNRGLPANNMVVYTAVTNRYDRLLPLENRCVRPARQVAFLDKATRASLQSPQYWEIREVDLQVYDPNRQAKHHKVRPDLHFPDMDYSLWIDGNVSLLYPFDMQHLIDLYLAAADLCIFRHHARSCAYEEAEACKVRRLDATDVIDRQMARYRAEGFPEGHGLHEAVVILRRHSDAVAEFNRHWWEEICAGSRRDQLSFNYVQWKTGLPIAEFPLSIQEHNGLFEKTEHIRRRPFRIALRPILRAMTRRVRNRYFDAVA